MNFNQLVSLYEAKNEKPGERYKSVQDREGPAGLVSGPIGKADNFELRKKQNKWEYDPSAEIEKGNSGFSASSKIWKNMLNSFGLLFNDPDFDKRVQKIAKTFNDNRDSYKLIGGLDDVDESGKIKKYDEEAQLEKLERNKASFASKLTEYDSKLREFTRMLNYTKLSPSEKNDLETEIAKAEAAIKVVNKHITKSGNKKAAEKYQTKKDEIITRLDRMRKKFDAATMDASGIKEVKSEIFDLQAKLDQYQEKYDAVVEELESLYQRINKINENNEKANAVALDAFKNYMKYAAQQLVLDYQGQLERGTNVQSLEDLDWDNLPSNLDKKIEMLQALASDDPRVNPILGYLEQFERAYNDKGFDERELDSNVNITKMRDYNRLPFMTILRIYNAIRSSVKSPIPLEKLDVDNHKFYHSALMDDLKGVKTEAEWNSPPFKERLKTAITNLAISQNNKDMLLKDLNDPWIVNPRTKLTANKKMEARAKSMAVEKGLKNESASFDDIIYSTLINSNIDFTDYTLDLMEFEQLVNNKKWR